MMEAQTSHNGVIGVLQLQGDFAEHEAMLKSLGAKVRGVRSLEDLESVDALVLPGGESTTIAKLLVALQMMPRLKQRIVEQGMPVFGTCAGCILMANELVDYPEQPRIGCMDISVRRNAYGAQIDSFECEVASDVQQFQEGPPLRAILIRAPEIMAFNKGAVKLLAHRGERAVLVQQGHMLATTFHPEITTDSRIHAYFLQMVSEALDAQKQG
ncbi:Pyridoxal 5'-phosphate synthase subunit PdxT [Porphyridium purpureum]|uniref:glutaminase n=1 Tax=Porphyridium purpureum TaxID=35688 RepID=A0A5J4Z1C7_PORPP|nr:Pyridoxal 5'-phosphate synthase subunit PdxT [Porphyridium purpureum]|eukprot:POR1463..scf208_2